VNRGDLVRIDLLNNDVMPHDWVVDELNARTEIINKNESTSVEFRADIVGTFEYYCSVGQHRQRGMFGNIKVQ
jgi:plastocyanin